MAFWQVKLGKKDENIPNYFYEALADEQSLLAIGYGIVDDTTKMDDSQIKDYIEKINDPNKPKESDFSEYTEYKQKLKSFKQSVTNYVTYTRRFNNKLKRSHAVISPFNYIKNRVVRIGVLTEEFGTLKSLFIGDLNVFLNKVNKMNQSKITLKECQNLPARRIIWITDFVNVDSLNQDTIEKLKKFAGLGTVNRFY